MANLKVAIIPVTPLEQNCALIWDDDSKDGVVVDPGGDVGRIREVIDKEGVRVETILLTHGHVDHAAGAAELKEALGATLIGPDERDLFLLQSLEKEAALYGLTGARDVTPDRWLCEGETIDAGPCRFEVLHCPGHTPGHIVFIERARKLAVVGDVLFRGSIGRTDFPYGDHAALIAAIKEKLLPLGDDFAFLCGHGPPSTLGEERTSNPFVGERA